MSKSLKANILKYSSAFATGILIVWFYISSRWSGDLTLSEKYCILCDAFTLPGAFMCLFALLITMNNLGALDSLAYLMSFIPRIFAPGVFGEQEKYLDFVEARREKRMKGYGFLYIVGGIFLGIAIVFLVLFSSL